MRKYSFIDDVQGNDMSRNGYERFEEEQEKLPEPDHKSMLRALLHNADEVSKMTLDELRAKITAILPGATFEVDELGHIVIRSSSRLHIDPEALAETLRRKARYHVRPKKRRFGRST